MLRWGDPSLPGGLGGIALRSELVSRAVQHSLHCRAAKPNNPVPDFANVTVMGWGLDEWFQYKFALQEVSCRLPHLALKALCRGLRSGRAGREEGHVRAGMPLARLAASWTVQAGLGVPRVCGRAEPARSRARPLQVEQQVLPLAVCQAAWGTPDPPWTDDNNEPQPVYNTFWNNSMMCAAGNLPSGDKSFCPGDSGGPLIVRGAHWTEDVQIGTVSFVSGDCKGIGERALCATPGPCAAE